MTLALVCAILSLGFIYVVEHDRGNWLAGFAAIASMWGALGLGWYIWPA